MKNRGKKYLEWKEKYWTSNQVSFATALQTLKKNPLEKFDSSLNLTFHLNLNPKKSEQNLKGHYSLPFSSEKKTIIAVFSKGKQDEAEKSGAQIVGGVELIEEIFKTKKINFDVALATPDIARDLAKIAPILGPRKLMPTSKNGTMAMVLDNVIQEFKKGRRNFQTDGSCCLQFVIGKMSDSIENLTTNYNYVFEKVIKMRPQTVKGKYLKGLHLSGVMTPNFHLELNN